MHYIPSQRQDKEIDNNRCYINWIVKDAATPFLFIHFKDVDVLQLPSNQTLSFLFLCPLVNPLVLVSYFYWLSRMHVLSFLAKF